MKHLGIDFGTRRIGLAMSDASGVLAFPHTVIQNDLDVAKILSTLIIKEGIEVVVVGHSLAEDGSLNTVHHHIEKFSKALYEICSIPIVHEDERMSSHNATLAAQFGGLAGRNQANTRGRSLPKKLDAQAAALILQRYLDKQNALKE